MSYWKCSNCNWKGSDANLVSFARGRDNQHIEGCPECETKEHLVPEVDETAVYEMLDTRIGYLRKFSNTDLHFALGRVKKFKETCLVDVGGDVPYANKITISYDKLIKNITEVLGIENVELTYDEKCELVDNDLFDRAWTSCEKEFAELWRTIKMDTKRDVVLEKYERMCEARELSPYMKGR